MLIKCKGCKSLFSDVLIDNKLCRRCETSELRAEIEKLKTKLEIRSDTTYNESYVAKV